MTFILNVKKREAGKPEEDREKGMIPAILYGQERKDAVPITLEYGVFEKLYDEAGDSSLIDFTVEGEKESVKVLIQDVQYDPIKGGVIHVDFRQIKMGEEMSTAIEFVFVGESLAVKELGGTLMKGNDYLNIRCLPKDLVSEIKVDLSKLKTFDDVIKIEDLKIPEGIMVTDNPDTVVAKVSAPLTEEELKAAEEAEAPSVEEVKVEEKGKTDEEGGGEEGEKTDSKEKEKKAEK